MKKNRKIIEIDKDKCNGCGLCVKACAESALKIVNGKAELVSESYCDGLGACIGKCPQDAIKIIERAADDFDAAGVAAAIDHQEKLSGHCACAGSKYLELDRKNTETATKSEPLSSELTQWPVQLHLISPNSPCWKGADLLISADCVMCAYGAFQSELLKGRKLVIACPKLDDTSEYESKLIELLRVNDIRSVTVARMEVPCCSYIASLALAAYAESGSKAPFRILTVGIDGSITDSTKA